ncbi:Protein F09B12.3 [Aphelenchoides avenae]|nr:Protein F09B12.3 [Aphelenchus avenae]
MAVVRTGVFLLLCIIARCTAKESFDEFFEAASREHDESSTEEVETNDDDFYRVLRVCWDDDAKKLYTAEGKEECREAKNKVAVGKYHNGVNETGWGTLEVETFPDFPPEIQAYAAGVAEGVLTKLQIYYHFRNTAADMCKGQTEYCKRLYKYLQQNMDWIKSEVVKHNETDLYWRQVNLTYTQVTGIFHGYTGRSLKPSVNFDVTSILMLQLSGELIDLQKALKKKVEATDDPEPSKCSGFVKLTKGNKDLLMSHVSMSGYQTMNRVLKLYKFAYNSSEVPGYTTTFSGYPAGLASADDYTLTSAGLLSIETTISVFNETLYTEYVKPEGQLHCWVRSVVSNQLAKTAHEWVKIFALYNSGTYNNQWTVVDYKLFKPGQELPNNDVIWILEQVPGHTVSSDVTWFLRKYTYWPSYNIPYLRKISKLSGFVDKGKEQDWWKWGASPRARMFHRDHEKVHDLDSLRALMRYNNYTQDPLSRCACTPPYTAEAAISTRGDLNPADGKYPVAGMGHRNHGSLDFKGTNYENFVKLRFQVVGGPTCWNTTNIVANHFGQPTVWKFDAVMTDWHTPVGVNL